MGRGSGLSVETVPAARYEEWLDSVLAGFGYSPASDDSGLVDFLGTTHPYQRAVGVRGDSGYLATAAAIDVDLMLPGGRPVEMAGVSCVSVDSTVRRKGLLSEMMRELHRTAVERGRPVAGLFSSEWPIYERYGYGPAVWTNAVHIDVREARWRADAPEGELDVHRVADTDAGKLGRKLHEEHARATPGEVIPPARYWDRFMFNEPTLSRIEMKIGLADKVTGLRQCVAVGDRGFACYRMLPEWSHQGTPMSTLLVTDFLALDSAAESTLWRYLFSVDLVTRIDLPRAPVDSPLRWWVADARHIRSLCHDSLWLRPLDVATLLEKREWYGDGSLTFSVDDREGYAAGTFRLDIESGVASCRRVTTSRTHLEMNVSTLGSVLLGGNSAASLFRSGRIRSSDPSRVRLWDMLMAPQKSPFVSYSF